MIISPAEYAFIMRRDFMSFVERSFYELNPQTRFMPGPHLEMIAAKYSDARQYTLDGVSVEYDDWHFNVRPSNTEPLLRLNLEATTKTKMEQKRDEVIALIRA